MSKRHQNSMFLSLDSLIVKNHPYRKLDELLDFYELSKPFHNLYSNLGRKEKGIEFGLRCLVLQFMEDRSDREMERFSQENNAGQWFCEISLGEKAPEHSYFGDFRKRLGTENLMDIFARVTASLKSMNLIREVFTFVDSSKLISKPTTWDERDKAIKQGLEEFNNQIAEKVAVDNRCPFWLQG